MLLRWREPARFIFVANTKCASRSLEASRLANIADLKLTETPVGKHMPLVEIHRRFDCIFETIDFADFFKFGVIRDPLEWVVSWYKFRARPTLRDPAHRNHKNYTGEMNFSQFWRQNKDQKFLKSQTKRFFSASDERIRPDYLIRLDKLDEGLAVVAGMLGQKSLKLKRINASRVKKISVADLDDAVRREILEKYSDDYALLGRLDAYNADRLAAFRARPGQNVPRGTRVVTTLENFVRDTALEPSAVAIVNFIRGIRRP